MPSDRPTSGQAPANAAPRRRWGGQGRQQMQGAMRQATSRPAPAGPPMGMQSIAPPGGPMGGPMPMPQRSMPNFSMMRPSPVGPPPGPIGPPPGSIPPITGGPMPAPPGGGGSFGPRPMPNFPQRPMMPNPGMGSIGPPPIAGGGGPIADNQMGMQRRFAGIGGGLRPGMM